MGAWCRKRGRPQRRIGSDAMSLAWRKMSSRVVKFESYAACKCVVECCVVR